MSYPNLASMSDLPGWLATELAFYGLVASLLTGAVMGAILLVALAASRLFGSPRAFAVGRRLAPMCVAALVLGAPANLVFTAVMRYRFYVPGDPLVDWLPFIPSGAWLIDPQFGGRFLAGGSPDLLFWGWLALAVPVWCGAAVVGRWLDRSMGRPPSLPRRSAIMSA